MIGDLIKPSGDGPRGGGNRPRGRSGGRVRLYRTPLYRRRWVHRLFLAGLVCGIVGVISLLIILKPHRDQALSYDLEEMKKLERASIIYDRHRVEIGRIFVQNRQPVDIDEIPYHLVQALIAAEDSRFYTHKGVDFIGIARAALKNVQSGGYSQGASTITQQLARQAFGLRGKNIERKLTEAFLAHRIEEHYSKREILELYLNRIYFGSSFYGIEAAARGYFGRSAKHLTIEEAATLCGLIKSPNRLSPLNNPEASVRERNYVLNRMAEEGHLSREERDRLVELPLETSPSSTHRNESYVYETIRQRVIDRLGWTKASEGGFKIFTTIDAGIQNAARDSLQKHLTELEENTPGYRQQTYGFYERLYQINESRPEPQHMEPPDYLQGAVLMLDNATGAIVALVGGRDYRHNEFNRALQAKRPAGTAFKPLVYAAAFENGRFPGTQVNDSPMDTQLVMLGGLTGILGEWGTENPENKYAGDITAREALAKGKTAATVRLAMDVGLEEVKDFARRAGVRSPLREYPSTFLGASEVTVAEMTLAYTTFPNQGVRPARTHILQKILDVGDETIYQWAKEEAPDVIVTDPVTAYQVSSVLEQALKEGTGAAAVKEFGLPADFPAAGKTGTHYDFGDLWFIGYDSQVTCAVWTGFDKPQTIYKGAFGSRIALPVWVDVMLASKETFPPRELTPPETAETVEICSSSGLRATDQCFEPVEGADGSIAQWVRSTYREVVRKGDTMSRYCDVHGKGEIGSGPALTAILSSAPAVAAIDGPAAGRSIVVTAPTVVGDDPFNSVRPVMAARAARAAEKREEAAQPAIPRAEVVAPASIGSEKSRITLDPLPPLKFD